MIAIIPARGGSKGLPGKNIKPFLGKPLIEWTIKAAREAKNISRIIVSTDNKLIADVALKYEIEVHNRPSYLATDNAQAIDLYKHLIEKCEFNEFVVLQPTSPLRDSQDIDKAIDLFREKDCDSVVSMCEEDHPIYWHKKLEEGRIKDLFDNDTLNRQKYEKTYHPNGAIYVYKSELVNSGKLYGNSYAYIMDRIRSVDIDTKHDFDYAEYLGSKSLLSDNQSK